MCLTRLGPFARPSELHLFFHLHLQPKLPADRSSPQAPTLYRTPDLIGTASPSSISGVQPVYYGLYTEDMYKLAFRGIQQIG